MLESVSNVFLHLSDYKIQNVAGRASVVAVPEAKFFFELDNVNHC